MIETVSRRTAKTIGLFGRPVEVINRTDGLVIINVVLGRIFITALDDAIYKFINDNSILLVEMGVPEWPDEIDRDFRL